MRQSDDIDLDRRLAELAEHIVAIPSVREETARRVSSTSMNRSPLWSGVPIAFLVVVVGLILAIHSKRGRPTPAVSLERPGAPSLEMDGLTVEQDFAAAIGPRAILVGWSFRGVQDSGLQPARARRSDSSGAGFTEIPIRSDVTRDGRTFCWSLFVANHGDIRTGDCPTVAVRVGAEQIGFGASPHVYPAEELSQALADVSRQAGVEVTMNEVRSFLRPSH